MMRERAIVKVITVQRGGAVINFQIKLPRDVKRIIAIELGGFNLPRASPIPGKGGYRNKPIGTVRLMGCEASNIFYSGHWTTNAYVGIDEWSERFGLEMMPYTHQGKKHEEEIHVDANTTIIHGVYRDGLPEEYEFDGYTVTICIWMELKEKKNESSNSI